MRTQQIARVPWEAVPADQIALEPHTLVVLDVVVVGVPEAETVRGEAVLVVDHLGVVVLPSDVASGLDLVRAMLTGANILGLTIADPDGNVLPSMC